MNMKLLQDSTIHTTQLQQYTPSSATTPLMTIYNGTKLIKTVKKAQHLDSAEYIVIKKERPAMNRNQPIVTNQR